MALATATQPYAVSPFSGANYVRNSDRARNDEWPCAICGKPTINASVWAVVCEGGARWCDSEEPDNCSHGGHMGSYPIGADCHRRYRTKERES